jgi:hypothetical protein
VSNAVSAQPDDTVNDRLMSAMVYAWGQFIDHDLDATKSGTAEAFNVPVPAGDPTFDPTGTGTQSIPLTRSAGDPATGTGAKNPRQQINTITAFLDGSMVYGSDAATAASLRAMSGGLMKTSAANLLPTDQSGFFQAGDARANENPELTSLQTLFVREHNRIARALAAANPAWTDEQLYQGARAQVIGELQAITYNQWLPALLGPGALPAYRGYNPNVNPGISNEFATAAFRFGHSVVGSDIEFLDDNGSEVAPAIDFGSAFFNPAVVKAHGIDPMLKYLASDPAQEVDPKVVDELRNLLITGPGQSTTLDLAALNIQRGRDHGLADYNTTRAAYGLPKVTTFAQITSNPALLAQLKSLYGTVNNIDLWGGLLAEDHVKGGSVGPTLRAIVADQFLRLRDGDRFWYQSTFAGDQLKAIDSTTLADVIRRNTALTNLQPDVFVFRAQVTGVAFADFNADGKLNGPETGRAGVKVQLVNADGDVVATKTTDAMGRYFFGVADGLTTGSFTVQVVAPDGSAGPKKAVAVTRGDVTVAADIALPPPKTGTPPPPPPSGGGTGGMPPPLLMGIDLNPPPKRV